MRPSKMEIPITPSWLRRNTLLLLIPIDSESLHRVSPANSSWPNASIILDLSDTAMPMPYFSLSTREVEYEQSNLRSKAHLASSARYCSLSEPLPQAMSSKVLGTAHPSKFRRPTMLSIRWILASAFRRSFVSRTNHPAATTNRTAIGKKINNHLFTAPAGGSLVPNRIITTL